MTRIPSVVRILGVTNPVSAMLVQLQAELDAAKTDQRLRKLEDPISALHPEVPDAAASIYEVLRNSSSLTARLPDHVQARCAKPLAVLEANGHIRGDHAMFGGKRFLGGVEITSPGFMLYMCWLSGEGDRAERLIAEVEGVLRGQVLDGPEVADRYSLPLAVVASVFALYEQRGLGHTSKEVGRVSYQARY